MDPINHVYNGKLWKINSTVLDKNTFFHAAFGVKASEDDPYLDKRAKFRRMRWATFLSYFEDEAKPLILSDILKKCLSENDKYKHNVENQDQFEYYISDILKAKHDITIEEIPILATLDNVTIVLFKNRELEPVTIINPDFELVGSYPHMEKPKEEVVLHLEENIFSRMSVIVEDTEPKTFESEDKIEAVKTIREGTEQTNSGLIKYKKGGSAGSEGVQFQVGLLTVFFLNALQKLRNWKLSTENKAAGKFDDVVLECSDGATLLQAKHRQNRTKRVTFEELVSINSKNNDFSLPKYFLSYEEIKKTFKLKGVIICTNASVDGKVLKFLKAEKVPPESMLYYENCDYKFYTFSDAILPCLKENIKNYYENNFQNKDFDESAISDENIKEFLRLLQFYPNYPPGNNVGKVTELVLPHMNRLKSLHSQVSSSEIYSKMLDWFQQKDGVHLTELYAKAILSEICRDKHWQKLQKYNVFFEHNDLNFQNSIRLFHITVEGRNLLQQIKIFYALQDKKTRTLFLNIDDGTENQKQVMEAFSLPQYFILILVWHKVTEESVINEVCSQLREIFDRFEYKKVVLVAACNNKIPQRVALSNDNYHILNQSIILEDLSKDSQERLLKKRNIVFQGNDITLEELLSTTTTENYGKCLNSEILEMLVSDKKIKVGAPLLELDENIVQFYIKRKFKRKKNKDKKAKLTMGEEFFSEDLICELNEKVVLISDSAGTGKSTVLTNLSVIMKKRYPQLWIIRIDLNNYTPVLKKFLAKNRKTINVLDLLNSKYSTKLTNQLERITFTVNGKILLLLDGFDEISPDYTQLILNLISFSREQQNFGKIFVTTRSYMALELQEKLQVEPFILESFTEQNQIDFLTGYWMHHLNLNNTAIDKCGEFAKELIKKMSTWLQLVQQGPNHFAAIPLHVRMLAEIFQENHKLDMLEDWEGCNEYLAKDGVVPKLPDNMNITKLYKMFIEKKRSVFIDKGNPKGNTVANKALNDQFEECLSYHRSLALEVTLDKTKCELFTCYQQVSKDLELNVLQIGIVHKLDKELHFAHRTFAEYFFGESLIEELQVLNQNVEFQRFVIEEILLELQFNVIRVFFNSFLQQIVDNLSCKTFTNYQNGSYEITSSDIHKFNLLHYLAENGQVAIFQLILKCVDMSLVKGNLDTSIQLFETSFEESNPGHQDGDILKTIHMRLQHFGLDVKDIFNDKTLLEYASVNGHLEMVKFLVKQGANVDAGNFKPLHLAANSGHFEVLKFLVEQGADIKAKDPYHSTTVLYKIILRNDKVMATYLVDSMLNDGLNITDSIIPYTLAYLGKLEALRHFNNLALNEFIQQGWDVNSRVENGETLIFGAIRHGQLETIRYLVQQGSDINSRDHWNNTALHIISRELSSLPAAELLVELGIDLNVQNLDQVTALHIAVEKNNFKLIELLVNSGANLNLEDKECKTILHTAASDIQGDIVKFLVEHGANINSKDKSGRTALHLVSSISDTLYKNAEDRSLKYSLDHLNIIKCLIENGGDINMKDANGYTALHLTILSNQFEISVLLMELGADANIRDDEGRTVLHLAVFRNHADINKFLVQRKVDINISDNDGYSYSVIDYLVFSKDQLNILKLVVNSGDVNIRDNSGCTALHLATRWGNLDAVILLVQYGSNINNQNSNGFTALHIAVYEGHMEIVKFLLDWDINLDMSDNCGRTPLHLAAQVGDLNIACLLIEHGANVNVANNKMCTPLHLAAGCSLNLVTFLVEHGADIYVEDSSGDTAAIVAKKKGYVDTFKYLQKKLSLRNRLFY